MKTTSKKKKAKAKKPPTFEERHDRPNEYFCHRESDVANRFGLSAAYCKEYRANHLVRGDHWIWAKAIHWSDIAIVLLQEHLGIEDKNGVPVPCSHTPGLNDTAGDKKLPSGTFADSQEEPEEPGTFEPQVEEFYVQRIGYKNNCIKGERISDGRIFTIWIHKKDIDKYVLRTAKLDANGNSQRMKVYAKADFSAAGGIYRATKRPRRKGYY